MRIAYLDCASGTSGDMMLGALVDVGVPLAELNAGVTSLGLPGVRLVASQVKKKGFRATQITVEHEPEHTHRHLHHIVELIDRATITPRQKQLARRIFERLAEAEAKVHGTSIEKVHFHEVGAVDSIADIVGAAIGWDLLGVEQVVCSPVPTGTGYIEIAHGRCAIPAPATAELLKGVPLAESNVACELTTPTGAAILATLVERYGPLPAMTIERIGCGAGQRELAEQPNLMRLLVGAAESGRETERLWIVETNLDDASGELVGHAIGLLWQAGALDVYTTAIHMKKNRPGVLLSVLCGAERADDIESILFRETTTLGVRRYAVERRKLKRESLSVETPWGQVEGVVAELEGGQKRFSPEYESCRRVAESRNIPLRVVFEEAQRAWSGSS